jgi:hypothetical protein
MLCSGCSCNLHGCILPNRTWTFRRTTFQSCLRFLFLLWFMRATSRVFLYRGSEFSGWGKKNSTRLSRQSLSLRPVPVTVILTWATVPLCMGGAVVQGFLGLREKIFLMQSRGCLTPVGWVFLISFLINKNRDFDAIVSLVTSLNIVIFYFRFLDS